MCSITLKNKLENNRWSSVNGQVILTRLSIISYQLHTEITHFFRFLFRCQMVSRLFLFQDCWRRTIVLTDRCLWMFGIFHCLFWLFVGGVVLQACCFYSGSFGSQTVFTLHSVGNEPVVLQAAGGVVLQACCFYSGSFGSQSMFILRHNLVRAM